MVRKIPVVIWITSTTIASEPKKYQKLKFFGAWYSDRCFLYSVMIVGMR